jgi:hypothetical protein
MQQIEYKNKAIRFVDDMVNITDMWRAAGSPVDRRPADWVRRKSVLDFKTYLSTTLRIPEEKLRYSVKGSEADGRGGGGTVCHWHLALFYAQALSHEFHAWCNTVLREKLEAPPEAPRLPPPPAPAPTVEAPPEPPVAAIPPPKPVQLPEMQSPEVESPRIGDLVVVERHAGRLVKLGWISKENAAEAMTAVIARIYGFDFGKFLPPSPAALAPQRRGSAGDGPEVSTSVVDVSGFPFTAKDAALRCPEIDEWRRLKYPKRPAFADGGRATFFTRCMRSLRLFPFALPDYTPTMAEVEKSKAYAKVVELHENVQMDGKIKTVTRPHAYFSKAAVTLVREKMRKAIEDLKIELATKRA